MSKDANSFGHDKALAWESRGFVYTKRGCIVSTRPLLNLFLTICVAELRFFCCERFFVSITINDYSFRLLNWNTIITMAPNARMAREAYAIPSVTCSE